MTAEIPELTVLDTPIFDDLVIVDLEKHWDDEITCKVLGCNTVAKWTIRNRCCGHRAFGCDYHKRRSEEYCLSTSAKGRILYCVSCKREFPEAKSLEDVAIVREL